MVALAVILGFGGAWAISETVETVNDRILSAASRAMAESLSVEDGAIALELSPAIFGMLESTARDNVYYSVRHRGRVLTGYADLPSIAPPGLADTEVAFGTGRYLGRDIRIVAEARSLPQISGPVLIEVAETLDTRERTARQMLIALALLEAALVGAAAIMLPLAVRWGLGPVAQVRDEMDRRGAADLTPLSLTSVPRELRDLVRAFNAMLGRLDASVTGIRRFTADASHQMRTPLSILRTHVELLRRTAPGSAEATASIDDIDQASERLRQLLVQLLTLARADAAGPSTVALVPTDLNEVAAAAASECALAAVRANIELVFSPATRRPALIPGNAALAGELVLNIIDNAIRYNRAGGTVTVEVGHRSIAIEDDGPGIAPEDRERAFTRFTRLNRGSDVPGSGLGLPIARSLAEAIGAEIELRSPASGRGLRVLVRF
ncbi:MAG: histidine kinase [Sphingomonas bacterium]|uniref:sensor histidine kinase n=1 Tax=Sphingomonas bacterium TaxID=1895847 RepID=UPI002637560C|nr:sensor histidine kinase [Sphingomonas bacterium]MDB5695668.1 histidine kinase [Sphingomonas bacterium]